ncbi:MAG: cell division protein FtsQ/DivIB [Gallintestinimicrobium sp.]
MAARKSRRTDCQHRDRLLAAAALVVVSVFRVQNVSVEGNVHYTSEEIEAMVLTDRLSYNSLYLSLKYRNKEIRDIPFIETMSVRVDSPDSITIRVYEKSVAGYVEYMGRYMYFDRDGIVVESSETRTEGIPQVTGIRFDHVVLYEALPVKNTDIFQEILSITQMLSKHQITTDKIYFNESNEITLYFDNIRAKLGKDNLEEKVMRLEQILPNLSGESGVLDLQNYSEDRKNVTFQKDG